MRRRVRIMCGETRLRACGVSALGIVLGGLVEHLGKASIAARGGGGMKLNCGDG
jgi:hypothetical protein